MGGSKGACVSLKQPANYQDISSRESAILLKKEQKYSLLSEGAFNKLRMLVNGVLDNATLMNLLISINISNNISKVEKRMLTLFQAVSHHRNHYI